MKDTFESGNTHLPLEKAYQLGKTLSRGGIALADNKPAFAKKCVSR